MDTKLDKGHLIVNSVIETIGCYREDNIIKVGTNLYGGFGEAECNQNLPAAAVVVFGIIHSIKITFVRSNCQLCLGFTIYNLYFSE